MALFFALSGGAYAVVGNQFVARNGAISACVVSEGGGHELHVVQAGTACPRGSTALTLNQKGERGKRGPRGAAGATGPKGDTGATGLQGATGATGLQGSKGDAGATGATGLPGSQGPAGPQGPPGPVNQVVGVVQSDCTLQRPITGVTVAPNPPPPATATGCTITFPATDFTNTPVLMLTPINGGGGNPSFIFGQQNGDGTWSTSYTFGSSPPPLVNFIASQESR